jgi:hypothetical protein
MRIRSNEDVPGLGIALLPSLEDVAVRAGVTIDAIAAA